MKNLGGQQYRIARCILPQVALQFAQVQQYYYGVRSTLFESYTAVYAEKDRRTAAASTSFRRYGRLIAEYCSCWLFLTITYGSDVKGRRLTEQGIIDESYLIQRGLVGQKLTPFLRWPAQRHSRTTQTASSPYGKEG